MNIGQAARASGVSAKMIRHYETLGLLSGIERTDSGYRQYTSNNIATLQFIGRARRLGFTIDRIRTLLDLWQNKGRSSAEVKSLATDQISILEERLKQLKTMRNTLSQLIKSCDGSERPNCPILGKLAGSRKLLEQ